MALVLQYFPFFPSWFRISPEFEIRLVIFIFRRLVSLSGGRTRLNHLNWLWSGRKNSGEKWQCHANEVPLLDGCFVYLLFCGSVDAENQRQRPTQHKNGK
jgi:hypothetical protein